MMRLPQFNPPSTGGTLCQENTQGFTGTFTQMPVYGWQIDKELDFPKIVNNNSTFWVLGLKTENSNIAVQTMNGGKTEVLGGFMFANSATWATPIFLNNNSQFFGSFEIFNSDTWTENGITRNNAPGLSSKATVDP